MAAFLASGYIVKLFGIRLAFLSAFGSAILGGTLMIIFYSVDSAMAVFVLLSSFGTSLAFNSCYLTTPMVFPVHLTGTAFGICNLFARCSTILAPIIAEVTFPTPMIVFTLLSILH